MMHAGFGFKYDVIPGNQLGYRTIWVNRQGIVRPIDGVSGELLQYCKEDILCGDLQTLAYIIRACTRPMWKTGLPIDPSYLKEAAAPHRRGGFQICGLL